MSFTNIGIQDGLPAEVSARVFAAGERPFCTVKLTFRGADTGADTVEVTLYGRTPEDIILLGTQIAAEGRRLVAGVDDNGGMTSRETACAASAVGV